MAPALLCFLLLPKGTRVLDPHQIVNLLALFQQGLESPSEKNLLPPASFINLLPILQFRQLNEIRFRVNLG